MRPLACLMLGALLAVPALDTPVVHAQTTLTSADASGPGAPDALFGRLPLLFERAGDPRLDPSVQFLSRGRGYTLFLTGDAATLALSGSRQPATTGPSMPGAPSHRPLGTSAVAASATSAGAPVDVALRLSFLGADPQALAVGEGLAATRIHYLIGNDPAAWSVDNPTFERVCYRELWPGIDLLLLRPGQRTRVRLR